MKKLLILLISLSSFIGYSQTVLDPDLSATTTRVNIALQGAIPLSGTDTYTGTKVGATYTIDYGYDFKFANGNATTSPSINLNSLGAVFIRKYSAGSLVAVAANDLKGTMRLRYDGTFFVIDGIGNIGSGSGGGTWGSITGTLSSQTDLQSALNAKQATLSGTGFIKASGTTISYDNSTYLTSISGISAGGDLSGTYANPTVAKINGTSLAGLATGILKITTVTGIPSIAIAADFPTLNQNTTGSAATLTTPRSIYGNSFDGSAALAQIIASTYGGTGNGFTKFSGPATTEKTFTLPNANATILTDNTPVTAGQGGTGLTNGTDLQQLRWSSGALVNFTPLLNPSTTDGDITYYQSSVYNRLAIGANAKVLTVVAGLPSWQFPTFVGTTTNDNATSGNLGEYIGSIGTNGTSTVTISNASPGVITWASHGLSIGSPVNFTTTGGLPTGLTVTTNYYVCSTNFTTGSFTLSTTLANAMAGTAINTSSAGSGTHTAISNVILTTATALNFMGISLTAGDWDVSGNLNFTEASATSTARSGGLNSTTATIPTDGSESYNGSQTVVTSSVNSIPVTRKRFSLSATTTVYLVGKITFSAGTVTGFGTLTARRVR